MNASATSPEAGAGGGSAATGRVDVATPWPLAAPVAFVPNHGQLPGGVLFEARAAAGEHGRLVALEMLEKAGGRFRNTPLTAKHFVEGSPDNARPAMMHAVNLWPRWSTLTDSVRAGTAVFQGQRDESWTEAFIAAMDHNARERAPHVAQAVGAGSVRRMLDIGGGSGAFSIAFARSNPELRAEVLDLPAVVPITHRHIDSAGLAGRVTARAHLAWCLRGRGRAASRRSGTATRCSCRRPTLPARSPNCIS